MMKKLIITREKSEKSFNDAIKVKCGIEEYTFEDIGTIDMDDKIDINLNRIREENKEFKKENEKLETENEKLKVENIDLKKKSSSLSRERRKNEELKKTSRNARLIYNLFKRYYKRIKKQINML